MTTDKKNIQTLAEVCRIKGIKHIVFSPGSRSAPLVIAFSQLADITTTVIPDERVAGFFALGIAQQSRRPVAVVCTSGTAVLNLAPAICEAYYQQVPLLVLTADRPQEYIGIGENQAIDQTDIYRNYIRASFTLPESVADAASLTAQAIDLTTQGYGAPVHINIPLREPLYGISTDPLPDLLIPTAPMLATPQAKIALSQRNMLICGMHQPDEQLTALIAQLSSRGDFVIVTEPLSNLPLPRTINNIEGILTALPEHDYQKYDPHTIFTIGGQIVSKRLRQFLRKVAPASHYHLSTDRGEWNGLGAKTYTHINAEVHTLIRSIALSTPAQSDFSLHWLEANQSAQTRKKEFAATAPFSDWWVFVKLVSTYPDGANIQYGNSSPIRYGCLWAHKPGLIINANRGTSGIDGCVSTAAGAAFQTGALTISVIGDVSFFYDSNALWSNALSPHLRIIVINNGGGNIFRLIDGPMRVDNFEKFFETKHHLSAEFLAQMYQIPYYFCDRAEDMDLVLEQFYKPQKGGRPAILEIKTDGISSEKVYKDYFNFLKSN